MCVREKDKENRKNEVESKKNNLRWRSRRNHSTKGEIVCGCVCVCVCACVCV